MGGSTSKNKSEPKPANKQKQREPKKKKHHQPSQLPPLPDFFILFSDAILRHIFLYANRSSLRQISRCRTNRLTLLSLMEISNRDGISTECARRCDLFKPFVVTDSISRIFTPSTETSVHERTLRKICNKSISNVFSGFSESSAEYLTTLNTLAHFLLKQEEISIDQVIALVGYAYGKLIFISGCVSALALEHAGIHHQAHVASLQAVDIATGNWSAYLVQSCPTDTQNRDATAILDYLENRRLECGEHLDAVLKRSETTWKNITSQEQQRKQTVQMFDNPKESVWYNVGHCIFVDIWQALYLHLENMLTVGTTKYQTLNDTIISKIVNNSNQRKNNTRMSLNEGKKDNTPVVKSIHDEENNESSFISTTAPHSPRSKQRLKELNDLDDIVTNLSLTVTNIENALNSERDAKHEMYAEHDALLQSRGSKSFISFRMDIKKARYEDWVGSLAQMYGNLERLQFTKVDAIMTGDLNSGKTTAKNERKRITKNIVLLLDNIIELRKSIEKEKKKN